MSLQVIKPTSWAYTHVPKSSSCWQSTGEWTKCLHFPTEIHYELREAGAIPDWNKGRAEHDIQCERDFYQTSAWTID